MTIKDVEHIAKLARLELNDGEKQLYQKQLDSILGWMGQLNEADTASVEPTFSVLGSENVMREDAAVEFKDRELILANAPMREYDLVKVKKIIE